MKRILCRNNAPVFAFVLLALAGEFAVIDSVHKATEVNYQSALKACARGNILRAEVNRQARIFQAQAEINRGLLKDAYAESRNIYHNSTIVLSTNYKEMPLLDCKKVTKKP